MAQKPLISSLILPHLVQIWGNKLLFLWVLPLLDVRHCSKLKKMAKKADFRPDLGPLGPKSELNFFFKNVAWSVTRYHGQLSSCTISEKLMIQS